MTIPYFTSDFVYSLFLLIYYCYDTTCLFSSQI